MYEYEASSGKKSIGLKVGLGLDRADKGAKSIVGGSCSLTNNNLKVTGGAETDLSQSSVKRFVKVQTNAPNSANIGVQLKDNNSKGMSFFAPSNIVIKSKLVVSHCTNGDEIETTASVLPLQSAKDSAKSDLRHEKQIENQPPLTETRPGRRETQRLFIQESVPVYVIRRRETIVKLSLLAVLVCLLLFFVVKITSFLKKRKS